MTLQTALIVDDSKLARITLKKKLESLGLQVDMVESADLAFNYLLEKQPDILFMDHLMPDIDGFEATQAIRQRLQLTHLPIVMCTGKDHDGYLQEALAIGANYILSKPAADEDLNAILQANHSNDAVYTIPTLVMSESIPVVTPDLIPEVQVQRVPVVEPTVIIAGLSRDEVQLLCEEMLLANKAGFIAEALAKVPKFDMPTIDVDAISASIKNDVIQQVLVSLPANQASPQDNDKSLDMQSLLSTVNASVDHQMAVNAGSMKAAIVDYVQAQLNEIVVAQVTQMMEQDIQSLLDLRLNVTLTEKTADIKRDIEALAIKLEGLAATSFVEHDAADDLIPVARSSANNTQLLEKAFQSQVQMQAEITKLQKTNRLVMGVAGLSVVLAITALILYAIKII